MVRNYFKMAFRNLTKGKLFTAINLIGLSLGISSCFLIIIYLGNELSYDRFNLKSDRIVRVTMEYKIEDAVNSAAVTGNKVGPQLKRTFPAIEEYVRTYLDHGTVKCNNKIFDEHRILYADPAIFKTFTFKIISGDRTDPLGNPGNLVITHSMARKYFAEQEPLEKIIKVGKREYKITAVCEDVPQNSQIKFDFVTQFLNLKDDLKTENWWSANWVTYLLLKENFSLWQLQDGVNKYMASSDVRQNADLKGNNYLKLNLEPITKVHLYSNLAGLEPNGSINYVVTFTVVALLILAIACANYTNLSTAQSFGRNGEIGIRKVMGASRIQIFMQFICESLLITSISSFCSLIVAVLAMPYFNRITGLQFSFWVLLRPLSIGILAVFTIIVSFLAGFYPALILSGSKVLEVLKKGFSFTGGNNVLQKILIVVQFSASIFLIVYAIIIIQQIKFMMTKDLGYDKDHLVVVPFPVAMLKDFQNTKDALLRVPGVEGITASYETPEFVKWSDAITVSDDKGEHQISVNAMPVDLDFISTMHMSLSSGRDFQNSDFSIMDTSNNYSDFRQAYIINESLARKIGWTPTQAVGKLIKKNSSGPVVGVVRDFNFSSLHDPINPMLIFLSRDFGQVFMIRINGNNIQGTLDKLKQVWTQRAPESIFNYHFLDESYSRLYLSEQRTSILFSFASGLAIILSSLGLFGLAAFTTVKRAKEIGIRRVLGASVISIVILVSKNFIKLVLLAIAIALPVSWWLSHRWLQSFAFRIPEKWQVLMYTSVGTIIIAFCTVGYLAAVESLKNPAKSLKSE